MVTEAHSMHETESSLNRTAFTATLHCLTGCAIGEVLGMIIGTALGWSNPATIALSVVLAFLFGYSLTMLPLLRSGLALASRAPARVRLGQPLDRRDGARRQRRDPRDPWRDGRRTLEPALLGIARLRARRRLLLRLPAEPLPDRERPGPRRRPQPSRSRRRAHGKRDAGGVELTNHVRPDRTRGDRGHDHSHRWSGLSRRLRKASETGSDLASPAINATAHRFVPSDLANSAPDLRNSGRADACRRDMWAPGAGELYRRRRSRRCGSADGVQPGERRHQRSRGSHRVGPWLYNQVAANLTGLLVLGFALGLWAALGRGLLARLGVLGLFVVGAGIFLDGLFRLDCQGIDVGCDNTSWHSSAHKIESGVTATALLLTPFVLAFAFRRLPAWHRLWLPTLFATPALFAVSAVFSAFGPGIATRVGSALWFVWLALVALHLLRISTTTLPRAPAVADS